jgi:hexokinase
MPSFIAAMLKIRKAFYAAFLSSLLRTKSLLQTILELWIFPTSLKSKSGGDTESHGVKKTQAQAFLDRVQAELSGSVRQERLLAMSGSLKKQFLESMATSEVNMLPSYNHQLPSGKERGTFLALDVGGTTFRVAVIELLGKSELYGRKILKKSSFKISENVKQLEGVMFFDWMAKRIEDTVSSCVDGQELSDAPLGMGLSWSFPIEYVSPLHISKTSSEIS